MKPVITIAAILAFAEPAFTDERSEIGPGRMPVQHIVELSDEQLDRVVAGRRKAMLLDVAVLTGGTIETDASGEIVSGP